MGRPGGGVAPTSLYDRAGLERLGYGLVEALERAGQLPPRRAEVAVEHGQRRFMLGDLGDPGCIEHYLHGYCDLLAWGLLAITGGTPVMLRWTRRDQLGAGHPTHVLVRTPSGLLLDLCGPRSDGDVIAWAPERYELGPGRYTLDDTDEAGLRRAFGHWSDIDDPVERPVALVTAHAVLGRAETEIAA